MIERRRSCWLMGGRWYDEVYMDCLASEFESPALARIFAPDEQRPTGTIAGA
jgi:diamine N-acetyltransferase